MHQSGDLERLLGRPVVEMVRLPADAKELAPRLDGDPVAERFELVHLSGVTNHFARNRPSDFEFLFDNAEGRLRARDADGDRLLLRDPFSPGR